jgi:glycosyltransferase involved in cell wall biosynthesis
MKKIKVMHIIDKLSVDGSGIHGATTALLSWISNTDQTLFCFEVVVLRCEEEAGEYFEKMNVPVYFLNRSKIDPRTLIDLLKLIHKIKPNILHLHGFGASNFGRLASFITKTPNVLHEHAVVSWQPSYQKIADFLLSPLTDKAIAVATDVATYMTETRKIQKMKIQIIYNGIDINNFIFPEKSVVENERKLLGISNNTKIICSIGRLAKIKGLNYLIDAMAEVLKQRSDVNLLIVGEGAERTNIEKLCKSYQIFDNVIFAGFRKDVSTLFAMSDMFVMTSLSEGTPLSLLEAMNTGLPIVSFPAGGVKEILVNEKNGIVVPMKDVKQLSEKILWLLDSPDVCQKLGKQAKIDCKNYDISVSVQKITNIYKSVV